MTTIHILSDLHLEHCSYTPPDAVKAADIVILAGDIHKGIKGFEWARTNFPISEIIYVSGNHEFYHYDYNKLLQQFRVEAKKYDIHFLENDAVIISGIRFLGCTLWTDYTTSQGLSQDEAMKEMNWRIADHQLIRTTHNQKEQNNFLSGSFSTKDAWRIHSGSVAWLTQQLFDEPFSGKTIVITHHGPSKLCENKFYGHTELSGAFYSDLSNLIELSNLWVYGHTHSNLDAHINSTTRLISNQRGYTKDAIDGFNESLIIEI